MMKKYLETILYFIIPVAIAIIIGYLDNNPRNGAITGISIGIVFAILHHFDVI